MSNFNDRRGGLRTLSEVCPALGGKNRLDEIAPVFAALGRGALMLGQAGTGLARLGVGLAKGAKAGVQGAAQAVGQGLSPPGNVASGPLVPASTGPPTPPDAPKFSWSR